MLLATLQLLTKIQYLVKLYRVSVPLLLTTVRITKEPFVDHQNKANGRKVTKQDSHYFIFITNVVNFCCFLPIVSVSSFIITLTEYKLFDSTSLNFGLFVTTYLTE